MWKNTIYIYQLYNFFNYMYTELSRVLMSQSESKGSREWSPLPPSEKLETVWRFCRTVSRLNLGCFFEPAKKILFKGWYISNVRETGFSKLNQCLNTCFNLLITMYVVSQNTQKFSSFLRFIPLNCQTSNIYLHLNPEH